MWLWTIANLSALALLGPAFFEWEEAEAALAWNAGLLPLLVSGPTYHLQQLTA
jgi:hypothetical protein